MPAVPQNPGCEVCAHPDVRTLDRFLAMPDAWRGKRGPRSLARPFGLTRGEIRAHQDRCLVGERRAAVEDDLLRGMAGIEEGG